LTLKLSWELSQLDINKTTLKEKRPRWHKRQVGKFRKSIFPALPFDCVTRLIASQVTSRDKTAIIPDMPISLVGAE
jgi:hypothetical protein